MEGAFVETPPPADLAGERSSKRDSGRERGGERERTKKREEREEQEVVVGERGRRTDGISPKTPRKLVVRDARTEAEDDERRRDKDKKGARERRAHMDKGTTDIGGEEDAKTAILRRGRERGSATGRGGSERKSGESEHEVARATDDSNSTSGQNSRNARGNDKVGGREGRRDRGRSTERGSDRGRLSIQLQLQQQAGIGGVQTKGTERLADDMAVGQFVQDEACRSLALLFLPFRYFFISSLDLAPFLLRRKILSLTSSCVEIFAARIIVGQNRASAVDIARIYCNTASTATPCNTRGKSCDAVCCSVLQCVAVCCSVLQCVAVFCSVLQGHYRQIRIE